jgi:uncharacterized protein YdaU (DUF1376 family)
MSRMDLRNHVETIMLFYTRHLGDYARDTGHLTTYEHGVYTLLLDRFYATEKPFGEREAMQLCRPTNGRERDRIRRILNDFFILTASGYVNARAMKEMEKVHEKQAKAKQSAQTRWMRTHNERNADAMLSNNQYPITNIQKPKGIAKVSTAAVLSVVGRRTE